MAAAFVQDMCKGSFDNYTRSKKVSHYMYKVDSQYRQSVLVVGAVVLTLVIGFSLLFIIFSWRHGDDLSILAILSLFIGASFYSILSTRHSLNHTYLKLSETSIEYKTPGLMIKTSWSNIEKLDTRFGKPQLWLKEPAADYISFGMLFWKNTTSAQRDVDRRIPLYIFSSSLSQSDLYRSIQKFAPQLLTHTT